MHSDLTIDLLDKETTLLGDQLRAFKSTTCNSYKTRELRREASARERRDAKTSGQGSSKSNPAKKHNTASHVNAETVHGAVGANTTSVNAGTINSGGGQTSGLVQGKRTGAGTVDSGMGAPHPNVETISSRLRARKKVLAAAGTMESGVDADSICVNAEMISSGGAQTSSRIRNKKNTAARTVESGALHPNAGTIDSGRDKTSSCTRSKKTAGAGTTDSDVDAPQPNTGTVESHANAAHVNTGTAGSANRVRGKKKTTAGIVTSGADAIHIEAGTASSSADQISSRAQDETPAAAGPIDSAMDATHANAGTVGDHVDQASVPEKKKKASRRIKTFNLNTYKVHALGDYADTIKKYGTTDSYSTESVSVFKLLENYNMSE